MSDQNIEQLEKVNYLHLITNPVQFFKNIQGDYTENLLALVIWTVGISGTITRLDKQIAKYSISSSNSFLNSLLSDGWIKVWIFILVIGIVSGIISYYLNGLLFGIRLLWSKSNSYTYQDVRKKTVFLMQIEVLPHILLLIIVSLIFNNYFDYYQNSSWESTLIIPFLIIRWKNSYLIARDIYGANKKRSFFWFFLLPLIFSIVGFIVLILSLMVV